MPYTSEGTFEWSYPAHVISVVDGCAFIADIDLGFNIVLRAIVVAEGIECESVNTQRGLAARKEAQKLLRDAHLVLRTRRLYGSPWDSRLAVLSHVAYSPYHVPRSEQWSFSAAMLASGYATQKTESIADE